MAREHERPLEPLTPEEREAFLAQVRAEGRVLTPRERAAIYGSRQKGGRRKTGETVVDEMAEALLDTEQIVQLQTNFFPELPEPGQAITLPLVRGVIFDFDDTLASLSAPLDDLLERGAQAAEAYMRSTGMELPEHFWRQIIEARRFAQEKSQEEHEEHLADDAMSFLLQFYGYPASKLDPEVLKRAVDIFYAPEMTAWRLHPHALSTLQTLHSTGLPLAVLVNYNCDRVFQRTIDYLGIRPYLDVCIASASVEHRKPDGKLFQIVLDRWKALPYEIVVVGDSLQDDIQGGIDLGALTVQCTWATTPQVLHDNAQLATEVQADAVIDDFRQLPALVQAWRQ